MKQKKQASPLSRLIVYAGKYKGLLFSGLLLSAVAMILGMAPYVCIWLVVKELIGAILTILVSSLLVPVMPYMLSFAAGAMIYVVVEELIPEMSEGEHSDVGVIMFALGFTVMMILDVALG